MTNRQRPFTFLGQTIESLFFLLFLLLIQNDMSTVSATFHPLPKIPQNPCSFTSRLLYNPASTSDQNGLSIQLLPLARNPHPSVVAAYTPLFRCIVPIQYEHRFIVGDNFAIRRIDSRNSKGLLRTASIHSTSLSLQNGVTETDERLLCFFGCLRVLYRVSIQSNSLSSNTIISTGHSKPTSIAFHVLVIMKRKWPSCNKLMASELVQLGFKSERRVKALPVTRGMSNREQDERQSGADSIVDSVSTRKVILSNIPIGSVGKPQPIETIAPDQPVKNCVPSMLYKSAGEAPPLFPQPAVAMQRSHHIFHRLPSQLRVFADNISGFVGRLFPKKLSTSGKVTHNDHLCTIVLNALRHRLRVARADKTTQASYSDTVINLVISPTDPLPPEKVVASCILAEDSSKAYIMSNSQTSFQNKICRFDGCKIQHFHYSPTGQIIKVVSSAWCIRPELLACPLQSSSGTFLKKNGYDDSIPTAPTTTQSRKPIPAIFQVTEPSDDRRKAVRSAIKMLRNSQSFANMGERQVIKSKVVRKGPNRFIVILWFSQQFLEEVGDGV